MKKILVLFLLLLIPVICMGETWKYTLKDAVEKQVDKDGQPHYYLKLNVIDYYINRIAKHAGSYPPHFNDVLEKKQIHNRLEDLFFFVETMQKSQMKNPEFLRRAAFIYSMGHNLDIQEAASKSKFYYEEWLKLEPNSPDANYMYGMFLTGTQKYHFEGIPFLKKSLQLGVLDAQVPLGLIYYEQGNKEKGLKLLREYSQKYPKNAHVKKLVSAIESGELKFHSN